MTWRRWTIVGGTLAVLGWLAHAVVDKEHVIRSGTRVRLELRGRDPRSLMQGDYMALRYTIGDELSARPALEDDGLVPLDLGANAVATLASQSDGADLWIRYRVRGEFPAGPRVGTDAFYFEEGTGDRYLAARYAELVVDERGESVLLALLDEDFAVLGTAMR